MNEVKKAGSERSLSGRVSSARMDKTVAVVIERTERHPVYGKFLRRRSKILAHDEANECREGDMVRISPCRPLSKRKAWRVTAIVERFETGLEEGRGHGSGEIAT
ncbi:MAG: 30S ribosomal protein S17 [Gammaproteobacteria bacterium]